MNMAMSETDRSVMRSIFWDDDDDEESKKKKKRNLM